VFHDEAVGIVYILHVGLGGFDGVCELAERGFGRIGIVGRGAGFRGGFCGEAGAGIGSETLVVVFGIRAGIFLGDDEGERGRGVPGLASEDADTARDSEDTDSDQV
jgi:hypothetical protein